MHERFNDPAKAACYVGLGLTKDFPNTTVEITYRSGLRVRQELSSSETAERILEQMLKRFHRAVVRYDAEGSDGVIVRIECHCVEGIKGTCCSRGADRPNVTIRLTNIRSLDEEKQDAAPTPFTLAL